MNDMAGYNIMLAEMEKSLELAKANEATAAFAGELEKAVITLKRVTQTLLGGMLEKNIDSVLSNSAKYLDLFGNIVIAWLWLKQGLIAAEALANTPHAADESFYRGKLQAMQYFYRFELPEIYVWSEILENFDTSAYDMQADWF